MTWIHREPTWPELLTWDDADITPILADVRHSQGRLLGRIESIGFDLRQDSRLETLVPAKSARRWPTVNRRKTTVRERKIPS